MDLTNNIEYNVLESISDEKIPNVVEDNKLDNDDSSFFIDDFI